MSIPDRELKTRIYHFEKSIDAMRDSINSIDESIGRQLEQLDRVGDILDASLAHINNALQKLNDILEAQPVLIGEMEETNTWDESPHISYLQS